MDRLVPPESRRDAYFNGLLDGIASPWLMPALLKICLFDGIVGVYFGARGAGRVRGE